MSFLSTSEGMVRREAFVRVFFTEIRGSWTPGPGVEGEPHDFIDYSIMAELVTGTKFELERVEDRGRAVSALAYWVDKIEGAGRR